MIGLNLCLLLIKLVDNLGQVLFNFFEFVEDVVFLRVIVSIMCVIEIVYENVNCKYCVDVIVLLIILLDFRFNYYYWND